MHGVSKFSFLSETISLQKCLAGNLLSHMNKSYNKMHDAVLWDFSNEANANLQFLICRTFHHVHQSGYQLQKKFVMSYMRTHEFIYVTWILTQ